MAFFTQFSVSDLSLKIFWTLIYKNFKTYIFSPDDASVDLSLFLRHLQRINEVGNGDHLGGNLLGMKIIEERILCGLLQWILTVGRSILTWYKWQDSDQKWSWYLVEDVPVYQLLSSRPLLQLRWQRLFPSELCSQPVWIHQHYHQTSSKISIEEENSA